MHARMALDDLRAGLAASRATLTREEEELATIVRRQGLAQQIGDAETVAVAERFALQHTERVAVQRDKVEVQARELSLAEREYATMLQEFKRVHAGLDPAGATTGGDAARDHEREAAAEIDDLLGTRAARSATGDDFDTLSRAAQRAARDAAVDARLAELKARLGRGG